MNINYIKKLKKANPDLKIRIINNIYIIYFESICNMYSINEFILKPLKKNIKNLPNANLVDIKNKEDLLNNLYHGFTIIYYKNKFISFETKETLNSNITESSNEKTIKGPKDAFTENYQTNIGLIRKRIRSKDLIIKEFMIGSKSNTKVSMIYLNSCDKELVDYIDNNLSNINIEYVVNSNSIINLLNKEKYIFPNYIMTERPDLASFNIIKNRIIILTENTPQVIILPSFFMDYISNIDDNYQNKFNILITRIIRFISFFLSIIIPGYYLALTTFNQETLPTSVLINFSMQRESIPFPSIIEALILIITFEILREADTRIPFVVGTSMSIVGALVLGDAAVNAGLLSPIMIIIIALSSISSFLFNDNDIVNSIRIWKIIILLLGSILGLYGVYIGILLLIIRLASMKSFGFDFIRR